MRKNEKLQSAEFLSIGKAETKETDFSLTPLHVENLLRERTEMLESVADSINASLEKILREKIDMEVETLVQIIKNQKLAIEARESRKRILSDAYFIEKSLDVTIFE